MKEPAARPAIVDAFLEHRQTFSEPWVQQWGTNPNPFIVRLFRLLRGSGIDLADFAPTPNAATLAEVALTISLRKWNAGVRIGLDSVTYLGSNPRWEEASQWVVLFEQISSEIQSITGTLPATQQATMWFHVTPGGQDFGQRSAGYVNNGIVGEGQFYGLIRHRLDEVLTIDKSVKYGGGAFVRIQRTVPGGLALPEVFAQILRGEVEALSLLGVSELS